MKEIKHTREQINKLDQSINDLLKKRFILVDEILDYKILKGEYIENPAREREVIEKLTKEPDKYSPYIKEVYRKIMEMTKCYQWNNLLVENIYIIGFMAVGKTTLGKKLSEKIQWEFLDTDLLIEDMEQRKIKDIFKESGEEYFRKLEEGVIENIQKKWELEKEKKIIACGGGIILNPQNVKVMKKNGLIVYLEGDINTIYNRLILDHTRPLLSETQDLKERIEKLLEVRRNVYDEVSDLTLYTSDATPKDLVEKLIRNLEDYQRERSLSL